MVSLWLEVKLNVYIECKMAVQDLQPTDRFRKAVFLQLVVAFFRG